MQGSDRCFHHRNDGSLTSSTIARTTAQRSAPRGARRHAPARGSESHPPATCSLHGPWTFPGQPEPCQEQDAPDCEQWIPEQRMTRQTSPINRPLRRDDASEHRCRNGRYGTAVDHQYGSSSPTDDANDPTQQTTSRTLDNEGDSGGHGLDRGRCHENGEGHERTLVRQLDGSLTDGVSNSHRPPIAQYRLNAAWSPPAAHAPPRRSRPVERRRRRTPIRWHAIAGKST